jgi:integrase
MPRRRSRKHSSPFPKSPGVPAYRLHRQSGQAIVTLTDGTGGRHDVLLGSYGTPDSRAEYARVIAEWEAAGRRWVAQQAQAADITVSELLLAYYTFAETYYVKNGKPTSQLARIRMAFKPLKALYGHTQARSFGPLALKAVREHMLSAPCKQCGGSGQRRRKSHRKDGADAVIPCHACRGEGKRSWGRRLINLAIGCIRRAFKWAVAEELLPSSVFHGLQALEGLRKGGNKAQESAPVKPVELERVEKTMPYLGRQLRAMVRLQQLAGMRPGEVIQMRPCDIERGPGPVWTYRPGAFKTEHHEDAERIIYLGPKAQEVLLPFLDGREQKAYCFSPVEATAEFRARQRSVRKTPVQPSQTCRRKRVPDRKPGGHYTRDSYRQAVVRVCLRAAIEPWHPNQLRHTAATDIRRRFGLEASQVVLGHAEADVTQVYAERDQELAAKVAAEMG